MSTTNVPATQTLDQAEYHCAARALAIRNLSNATKDLDEAADYAESVLDGSAESSEVDLLRALRHITRARRAVDVARRDLESLG